MMRFLVLLLVMSVAAIQGLASQQASAVPGGPASQDSTLKFGVALERDIRSGGTHEYAVSAKAGDLVSGTLSVRGRLAGTVEFVFANRDVAVARTFYFWEDDPPAPKRLGFVAPSSGPYLVRIKAFDRLTGSGTQWAPGALVPVVGAASGSYTLQLDDVSVEVRMRGTTPRVVATQPGPRLTRLSQDLQDGRPGVLESFWREVAGRGPIVQEIPGNDREADVTFLWREVYDTRNVLLLWGPRSEDNYLSRLPGTDVWYTTVRVRRGTRVGYDISPNDREEDRWATRQLDPLSPRRTPDDPTYPFFATSVLDMPGAPDEQWALRTPVRRGLIEERTVKSALVANPKFGSERQIWIYTPPGYTPTAGPYPLLVLLDGAAYVSNRFNNAPGTLDNLINDGRIRPTIALFDPGNRAGGFAGHAGYGEALVKEVLPMLRASYPISTSPADTVIGGFSAGGTAAAQIALLHSDVFGNVLSQSGAFRNRDPGDEEPNATVRKYLAAPRRPVRFYLEAGTYDNVPGANLPLRDLVLDETNLMGNRHLRDVLRAKGYDVTYREVGGGHEGVHWRAMLADGLMTLLGVQAGQKR
jgi:enterochelin esterase family protein